MGRMSRKAKENSCSFATFAFKDCRPWNDIRGVPDCLYFPLNRKLTGGFNLSTRLDAWIPLWPVSVVPYLLCLPFWVGGLIWAAWKMDEQLFHSFASVCLFVLFSATLFYYFIPTYIKRPILANGNWTMRILERVYRNDGLYNAFPSGHVYHTCLICLFYNRLYSSHTWVWISIVIVVTLSTLFTRQHHLADLLGGLAIAWADTGLACLCFRKRYASSKSGYESQYNSLGTNTEDIAAFSLAEQFQNE